MTTRLKDIAEALGVDVSTVSRALSGSTRVSAATRERIQAVAKSMDYAPNPAARSLVGARTRTVWLLLGGLEDPLQREFAQAVSLLLDKAGYDLSVMLYQNDRERYLYLLSRLNAQLTDGALVFSPFNSMDVHAELQALRRRQFPLVFVDRHPEASEYPTVTTDNVTATEALVGQLVTRGAKRFVVLMESGNNTVEDTRCMAALDALGRKGIPFTRAAGFGPAFVVPGEGMGVIGSSQVCVSAFFESHTKILDGVGIYTGVFDQWHGEPYPAKCVCVCQQDFPAMAERAASLLLDMLNGGAITTQLERVPLRGVGWIESVMS